MTATRTPGHRYPQSVESTVLSNGYLVSTINLDKGVTRELDALIGTLQGVIGTGGRADFSTPGSYETMVFACDEQGEVTDWRELDFARYTTEDDARAGHEDIVARWESK